MADGLDAFVTVLDPDLEVIYSTVFGGYATDEVFRFDVSVDGIVSLAGYTRSRPDAVLFPFPVTPDAFQPTHGGGNNDAFLARLRPDATLTPADQLIYSTFLGGSLDDYMDSGRDSRDVEVGPTGLIACVTPTASGDYPVSGRPGRGGFEALQPELASRFDGALTILDVTRQGSGQLVYSSYPGGSAWEAPKVVVWLDDERLAMIGWTYSQNFPQIDRGVRDNNDAWVTVLAPFEPRENQVVLSTTFGEPGFDTPTELEVTSLGDYLIAGRTTSCNFPAVQTRFPFQDLHQGFVSSSGRIRGSARRIV